MVISFVDKLLIMFANLIRHLHNGNLILPERVNLSLWTFSSHPVYGFSNLVKSFTKLHTNIVICCQHTSEVFLMTTLLERNFLKIATLTLKDSLEITLRLSVCKLYVSY